MPREPLNCSSLPAFSEPPKHPLESANYVMDFVHLHVHSMYSLLDGLGKLDELCAQAKAFGMNSLAITDHGTMYGAIDFYQTAKKHGIKPIIGVEAYVAPEGHKNKAVDSKKNTQHLVLLAKNLTGYKNLLKLTTIAHLEGFYYKPRVDKALLRQYSDGLIALSACLKGEIPKMLMLGDEQKTLMAVREYQSIFGAENFFLEVQFHEIPEQKAMNARLLPFAKKFHLPLVVTNDVHYVLPDDHEAQEVLVCVGTGKTLADTQRMRMTSQDFYLRSPDEMAELCKDCPDAIANTVKVAEMCNLEIPFGQKLLPDFKVPSGFSQKSYLIELCKLGLKQRYNLNVDTELNLLPDDAASPATLSPEKRQAIMDRLKYELSIIIPMGYDSYYLIVQDLVNTARRKGIGVGPGRGSGAGSMAAYLTRITNLDPLDHKLIFERFLNPERASMPDFDLDFADDRRDEIIQYCIEKYGTDCVAQIITFGSMMAKAAIRDTGRVLGMAYGDVDRISKLVPMGMDLTETLENVSEFKLFYDKDPQVHKLIDLALRLEGVARHSSTHAAAVVLSKRKLLEDTPLQMDMDNNKITTQYSMKPAEALGLLKIDFLGLRTLTIINNTVKLIQKHHNVDLDMDKIALDDVSVYDMLGRGETVGVFQIESAGMIRLAKDLKPNCFEDITAMVALFRPGPMAWIDDFVAAKHGLKKAHYPHPCLEPILQETYGIAVYQEQIQQIACEYAGFSLGQGYILIKAIGKKIAHLLQEQKIKFIDGAMAKQNVTRKKAEELFSFIEPFARYGFNKSHAACYALLTYQTAFLKHHYPAEFMAAMLTAELGDQEKMAKYIIESRRMGLKVLGPDINQSSSSFSIEDGSIRFGLEAIRNVGHTAIGEILQVRKETEFDSLINFCSRIDHRVCNQKVLESLIKSGAFDEFGNRNQQLQGLEQILAIAIRDQHAFKSGQTSLFGMPTMQNPNGGHTDFKLPNIDEIPLSEKLNWERDLLGYYFSQHPLEMFGKHITENGLVGIQMIKQKEAGTKIKLIGIVRSVRKIITKKKEPMAFALIEDQEDKIEAVIFPSIYKTSVLSWGEDKILLVLGKLDNKDGDAKIIVEEVKDVTLDARDYRPETGLASANDLRPENDPVNVDGKVVIEIPSHKSDTSTLRQVSELMKRFPGGNPVSVALHADSPKRATLELNASIDATHDYLKLELEQLLGKNSLRLVQ